MKKAVIVNIYNFIRKSHEEPSRFIQDDFDTIRKQMQIARQYGLPTTYALKYDALTDPRYQELIQSQTDEQDEISAWWEITREMCEKAGVRFRGAATEEFDERVNSAYSIGYEPEERKKLVDAYMDTFYHVFGQYPKTIGSWVLDTVTLEYAAQKYGIVAGATCRDQIGTDGFTLWGGYPNGIYYPSRMNENIPAQTAKNQLSIPVFRLLGPDPIYNFEQNLRDDLHGMVFTLEPVWLTGRDMKWITWMFDNLTEEDTLGIGYAQVGQENNFLWENIEPGFAPQLNVISKLAKDGKVRVETMAASAQWFRKKYRLTPPMTWQSSKDWNQNHNLSAQWYASNCYRLGFLEEDHHLRIRDFFLYRENYCSRYLHHAMTNTKSTFDALPVLYPQLWCDLWKECPFIRLIDADGNEPTGSARFYAENETDACAELIDSSADNVLARFLLTPDRLILHGEHRLVFDLLPVLKQATDTHVQMEHEGFLYEFIAETGKVIKTGPQRIEIMPKGGRISLKLGEPQPISMLYTESYRSNPEAMDSIKPVWKETDCALPFPPVFTPDESILTYGNTAEITLNAKQPGEIRYTTDGSTPDQNAPLYTKPIVIQKDTIISARVFLPDGRSSDVHSAHYQFALTEMELKSPTHFDPREVFHHDGIYGLLDSKRGTCDYLCGQWLGTLENLDVTGARCIFHPHFASFHEPQYTRHHEQ